MLAEKESKLKKKLSQLFKKTEKLTLGTLSKLEGIFLNRQVGIQSRTITGTSWNTNVENEEPTGDCSQKDPRPEADTYNYRSTQFSDSHPDEKSYSTSKQLVCVVRAKN